MSNRARMLTALQEATRLRLTLGYKIWDAVCIFDCAEQLGIEVRFVDIPSLEAMYIKGSKPLILVSSLRPCARQTFNCAHEIGHHIFNHGSRIDQCLNDTYQTRLYPEESLVQAFAGFFLMTKSAIEHAFSIRGWKPQSSTPIEIYTLAGWFGVGYETLIDHMQFSLKLILMDHGTELKKTRPQDIRRSIIGQDPEANLIVADQHWVGRSIDAQVGDTILVPVGSQQGATNIKFNKHNGRGDLYDAIAPGIGQIHHLESGWSAFVRVSKRGYTGRSIFRHLDDPEYG